MNAARQPLHSYQDAATPHRRTWTFGVVGVYAIEDSAIEATAVDTRAIATSADASRRSGPRADAAALTSKAAAWEATMPLAAPFTRDKLELLTRRRCSCQQETHGDDRGSVQPPRSLRGSARLLLVLYGPPTHCR